MIANSRRCLIPDPQLKPCPFCGSEFIRLDRYSRTRWLVCDGCGAESGHKGSEDDAIAAWNRRASGWQPIETAPRDKKIVVYADSIKCTYMAYWVEADEDWFVFGNGSAMLTHWQPLPDPPEGA